MREGVCVCVCVCCMHALLDVTLDGGGTEGLRYAVIPVLCSHETLDAKIYIALCAADLVAFFLLCYLQTASNVTGTCWFAKWLFV